MPDYTAHSTITEARTATVCSSTLPHLLEAQQRDISLRNKHEYHVQGEGFRYTILFPDQDVTSDISQNSIYAYKTTSDPDTLYLH